MIRKPIFIMSLDCELLWGAVQHPNTRGAKTLRSDPRAGRGAVDFLLNIFEKYNIPATWAILGHLFLDSCNCENGIPHQNMPRFKDDWFSCDPCNNIDRAPLYYGRDIVDKILSSPVKHEIGLHSFSHVPFSECSRDVAEAEVREGIMAAKKLGIAVKSFVFPYNTVGHVDVLRDNGFEIYRGQNIEGPKANQSFFTRSIKRVVDRMIAWPVEPKWSDGIWELPSSAYLSPPLFPYTLLPKVKRGISQAIRLKRISHIFLHPHDLLAYPSLEKILEEVLTFVAQNRDQGKLQVMTMAELAAYLNDEMRETR